MKFNNELFPAKISVGETAKSMILESNSAIYPPTENLSKNIFEGRTSNGTGVFSLLTLGCTRVGGGGAPLLRFFLIFFQGDNTSAPDVFCNCSFIYGYKIRHHKQQVVKPFLSENA